MILRGRRGPVDAHAPRRLEYWRRDGVSFEVAVFIVPVFGSTGVAAGVGRKSGKDAGLTEMGT